MYTFNGASDYADQREVGMGMGAIAGITYIPDLAPVGSASAGTYYPRDTRQDMNALHYLGFVTTEAAATHQGSLGSRAADSSAGAGAWDPEFQVGLAAFQRSAGITVDGWIGPQSRGALAAAVARKNALEMPSPLPIPPPPIPIPPGPNVLPVPPPSPGPIPGPQPVVVKEEAMPLTTKVAIGAGVLAVLGIGYYALK